MITRTGIRAVTRTGKSCYNYYMPGTTTELTVNAASNSGVVIITLEIFFLGLGLTVTDI